MAQHIEQGLTETHAMMLHWADELRIAVEEYLVGPCRARRAEAVGEYRRRVEVVEELVFVVEIDDFPAMVTRMQRYGGEAASAGQDNARFALRQASDCVCNSRRWQAGVSRRSRAQVRRRTCVSSPP
jgi:hypothetical protein